MAIMSNAKYLKVCAVLALAPVLVLTSVGASAQDRAPWERTQPAGPQPFGGEEDATRDEPVPQRQPYPSSRSAPQRGSDAYAPRAQGGYAAPSRSAGANDSYRAPAPYLSGGGNGQPAGDDYEPQAPSGGGYGAPYTAAPREPYDRGYGNGNGDVVQGNDEPRREYGRTVGGYYSKNEIADAGHGFFGSVSRGLASIIEYTFQKAGRPNGYILGEDAGGAFVAGLRYGEGRLHTKDAGTHKVYWQGPSLGYDIGAEGSKTMVLVYNLRDPSDLYHRFGGVQGTAYLVGGVSVQFQKYGDVILAPIRSGVGLRLGANVGYLKYTRAPTWNPF
jgi:hypothetical protein